MVFESKRRNTSLPKYGIGCSDDRSMFIPNLVQFDPPLLRSTFWKSGPTLEKLEKKICYIINNSAVRCSIGSKFGRVMRYVSFKIHFQSKSKLLKFQFQFRPQLPLSRPCFETKEHIGIKMHSWCASDGPIPQNLVQIGPPLFRE